MNSISWLVGAGTRGFRADRLRNVYQAAPAEQVAGAQVHRSHWVARQAVTGSRSEKNKCWVTTADGAEIPVSRTYRAGAEAAGMLPPA